MKTDWYTRILVRDSYVKFCPEIEENDEKILKATRDEVSAAQMGSKMYQNVNWRKIWKHYVLILVKHPEIEKNDEAILEATQDEVSAPQEGIKNVPKLKLT